MTASDALALPEAGAADVEAEDAAIALEVVLDVGGLDRGAAAIAGFAASGAGPHLRWWSWRENPVRDSDGDAALRVVWDRRCDAEILSATNGRSTSRGLRRASAAEVDRPTGMTTSSRFHSMT
jgi:hypothetical protein